MCRLKPLGGDTPQTRGLGRGSILGIRQSLGLTCHIRSPQELLKTLIVAPFIPSTPVFDGY